MNHNTLRNAPDASPSDLIAEIVGLVATLVLLAALGLLLMAGL
jgi:hypothetical protein